MFNVFLVLIIIVSLLLVLVIMVQNPKGGGLSGTFGGGGAQIGGAQKTSDFLDKSTWTLAAALVVLILLSNLNMGGDRIKVEDNVNNSSEIPVETTTPAPITTPSDTNNEGTKDDNSGQ